MLESLAIGDFVVRKSHNADVIFKIVAVEGGSALLRGVCLRIMADAPIEDLVKVDPDRAILALRSLESLKRKTG
ncbi:MAG: sporulation peptidase YabG [Bacillota bacterium]